MSNNTLRLIIVTNTNIRFIVSLASDLTIHKAFPIILKKYKSVVSQNFADHPELLHVNTITHLTKNGCYFAKDQIIFNVLNNNDQIQITVIYRNREVSEQKPVKAKEPVSQTVEQPTKKAKLDNKKVEKAAQPKTQYKKKVEEIKAKIIQKKPDTQKKQVKKDAFPSAMASDYLNKYRSAQKPKQSDPVVLNKKTVTIVEDDSDS